MRRKSFANFKLMIYYKLHFVKDTVSKCLKTNIKSIEIMKKEEICEIYRITAAFFR